MHGEIRVDPYARFRNRHDPAVRDYIRRENAYAHAMTAHLSPLRRRLYLELRSRVQEDESTVPERVDGYWYYTRTGAGKDYPMHCRRDAAGPGPEQVYLDENELAGGRGYFDLANHAVCPRHQRVAYVLDDNGSERYRLFVREIGSNRPLNRPLADVGEDLVWSNDGRHLFYTRVDETGRSCSVWAHTLGSLHSRDVLIYQESDPAWHLNAWKSRSRQYLFIEAHSATASEVHFFAAGWDGSLPQCFRPRRPGVEYAVDHHREDFLILTNEGASYFRLMATEVTNIDTERWRTVVPERAGVTLQYVEPFATFLVIGETRSGIDRVAIVNMETRERRYIQFPDPFYSVDVEDLEEFESDFVRIHYSSLLVPERVVDCCPVTLNQTIRKQQEIRGFDSSRYLAERLQVSVRDGTLVPVSLVRPRPQIGPGPLLLIGYGAYEETLELAFNEDLLSLLDRGVSIALAHVRGGGELGHRWHAAGKMMCKENSFLDFIDCADWLVSNGYTAAGSIAAWGGSAGGLLVAVAGQRRPELFSAVVAEVPFVDVINTLLDDTLPLTAHDHDEFGDPAEEAQYRYMLRYSPYDNVRRQNYPPMLVTAGMQDTRVMFWEPLKWVARLRANKTDGNPLLLRVYPNGHYGDSGRYRGLWHTALVYSFLLATWGLSH